MNEQFAQDILAGLTSRPKTLSSKYFYDKKGDDLFQQIMELDEYYLTRCEYEILDRNKTDFLNIFNEGVEKFNLVEFGAGDGFKTKLLLKEFLEKEANFEYVPIDISSNVLEQLEDSLKQELPDLRVRIMQNEYFKALWQLENGGARNVVLFLGSNIGNFSEDQAKNFLKGLYVALKPGDLVLIGLDLKKDPAVILNAYNDKDGVTAQFNYNLLDRINNELNGNFDLAKFKHYPNYDPMTGTTSSYLISMENQTVEIMDTAIQFESWEPIHTEISQKYDIKDIKHMAKSAGFKVVNNFFDSKQYFVNSIWSK